MKSVKGLLTAAAVQGLFMFQSVAWAAGAKSESSDSWMLVLAAVIMVPYFAPSIVGMIRKKDNIAAIIALNVFLGWTLVGWVVALVWSLSKDKPAQTIIIQNAPGNGQQ